MSAFAACIRGALCDVDEKYLGRVKSTLAQVELNRGKREKRADAHGVLVIHGCEEVFYIANDFYISKCGIERSQRMHSWMKRR